MKEFLGDDFLIDNKTGLYLYNHYAKDMPIFDFHCHLNPKEIYEDKKFRSITEVWLNGANNYGDHYKWRLMRAMGVSEDYITGNKSDYEKFLKWAETLPYAIGNPLYLWSHLELQRFFGINKVLNKNTAKEIYEEANKKLETLTARKLIEMSNVKQIVTTDDPIDSLEYHDLLKKENLSFEVFPAFRPDKVLNIELSWYKDWLKKLGNVVGYEINSFDKLLKSLAERIEFFNEKGCFLSDHALDTVHYKKTDKKEVENIFDKCYNNVELSDDEVSKYKTYVLIFLGKEYHKYGWAQQYHIGALRNINKRMLNKIGPDTGFDAINDRLFAEELAQILGELEESNELPKTILYNLNPRDNDVIPVLMQGFQQEGYKGKLQFGSAWWFNDQVDGISKQIEALSQNGVLSLFVGMLTDSRSFLSYTRHEFFRRILCNKLGNLIEQGVYPNDIEFVGSIVKDICYNNALNYFKK